MLMRTPRPTALLLAPMLALFSLVTAAFAAPPDITGLAPARTMFVLSVPNFKAFSETLMKTELGRLWEEPAVKAFVEGMTSDFSKGFSDLLKSVDADPKDFHAPEGQVGLALFFPEQAAKPAGGVPQAAQATPEPCLLACADMGEHAADYEQWMEKLLDKAVREKKVTVDHDTYQEIAVTVVKPVVDEEAIKKFQERMRKRGNPGEEDAAEDPPQVSDFARFIGGTLDDRRELRIGKSGNTFIACTDRRAFEDALDAMKGKNIDALADAPEFRATLDQHPAGTLATAAVMLEPLFKLGSSDEPDRFGPDPVKVLEAVGLRAVKTVSLGLKMDTPDGMVEVSIGALVPEKKGLLELISVGGGAFEPPAFVPADAAGFSQMSFDFPRLFTVVRSILGTFPEEIRGQMAPGVEMARDMTNQALASMGPAVHMFSSYAQPYSAKSPRTTFAIEVRDQEVVSNTIASIIAKVPGMMEPHEFEGNQTYSMEFPPLMLGVGFNRLFIGNETGVQGAMRLAGHHEGGTLAGEARFKEAARTLTPGAIMYSWADMEQELRWMYWSTKNEATLMEQQLAELGIEPEQRAEYMKRYKENQPDWMEKLPPVETLTRHVGDVVSELRATPDGFRGRVLMIRPSEKK